MNNIITKLQLAPIYVFVVSMVLCCTSLSAEVITSLEPDSTENSVTLWTLFKQGGWAMYPLLAFSIALVGLAVYCLFLIRDSRFTQPEALDDLKIAVQTGDYEKCLDACENNEGYMTEILSIAFETIGEGHRSVNDINEAMEERASKILAKPLVFVQYLQVIASIAPMMGLLGTVSGMVKAFRNIASQGLGKPELLANNISEALVTTASGLLIAIPALMAYFYFKNKYLTASSGVYEQLGSMTRMMSKEGMLTDNYNR